MKAVQLIFANYHCRDHISTCLNGIAKVELDESVRIEIVVINNGGPEFTPADAALPNGMGLKTLSPKDNVGYFGAVREAMAHATPQGLTHRILCNPDLEFSSPHFFTELAKLQLPPRCGVLAPSIISTRTRRDQNPYLPAVPSRALRQRWRLVYANWLMYQLNDWASLLRQAIARNTTSVAATEQDIYAPHGAMIVFAEPFLQEQSANLAQVPFLYAEELFIGEICKRAGWLVRYEPRLQVRHREHATTGQLASHRRYVLQRNALTAYLDFMD